MEIQNIPVLRERSAGAILFRRVDDEREYLLLHYPSGYWDFPKGNIEPGEEPLDTARREVKEETGLEDMMFIDDFEERITYFYRREGQMVRKEVIFYLAEVMGGEVRISWEHIGYVWADYDKAMWTLKFGSSRRLLEKAEKHLKEGKVQESLDRFLSTRSREGMM